MSRERVSRVARFQRERKKQWKKPKHRSDDIEAWRRKNSERWAGEKAAAAAVEAAAVEAAKTAAVEAAAEEEVAKVAKNTASVFNLR